MYVILVYDVGVERLMKVHSLCRIYLHHVQNSVFEGELTRKDFKALIKNVKLLIDEETDSIIVFRLRSDSVMKREVIGVEKGSTSNIIYLEGPDNEQGGHSADPPKEP